MMKGKSHGGVAGNIASSTLAYPGNSFKYSPKYSTDESQQNLNVFDAITTVQNGPANSASSECSNRLANVPVVSVSAEKNEKKLATDVSEDGFLQRQTRQPSQKCDEIYSLSEDDTLKPTGQNQEFKTEKVIVEVVQKVEKDIQEIEYSCKQCTQEVINGPKKYKN